MMRKRLTSGWLWLIDVVGAGLFAWGLAAAVATAASGNTPGIACFAAMLAGGAVRLIALALIHGVAIAEAQKIAGAMRSAVMRRLVGEPMAAVPALGESAVLAIEHPRAVEAFHSRFAPVRFAAAMAPMLVLLFVACASLVAGAILFGTLLPFAFGMILAGTAARRASEKQLAALGRLSGLFVDRLRNLALLRHFRAEERITRQVRGAGVDLAERTLLVLRAAFLSSAVLEFFSVLSVALVAVYCGFSLLGLLPFPSPETLTLREAFFALAMAPEFYLPMRRLAAAYHEKQMGEAAEKAIDALPPTIARPAAQAFSGVVADGLRIEWPGRSIGPVSFSMGRTGLFVLTGPTGSGKTSLLAAIAGQVAPASGSVTAIAPGDIGWAAQRPLLLPGSVRDNLLLGRPDASEEDLHAAIHAVGLDPLVAARGLDLMLDHMGAGLSGGERRRLGLARAIVAGRPLLLADEPTADLDADSAGAIAELLSRLSRERAVIVASHDPMMIARADREIAL